MRTVGELRAALDGVPDDAEWIVSVDAAVAGEAPWPDGVFVDPGATAEVRVLRPGDDGWPFADDDGDQPPAMAYLSVGEW